MDGDKVAAIVKRACDSVDQRDGRQRRDWQLVLMATRGKGPFAPFAEEIEAETRRRTEWMVGEMETMGVPVPDAKRGSRD